jgi:hypothetical protein
VWIHINLASFADFVFLTLSFDLWGLKTVGILIHVFFSGFLSKKRVLNSLKSALAFAFLKAKLMLYYLNLNSGQDTACVVVWMRLYTQRLFLKPPLQRFDRLCRYSKRRKRDVIASSPYFLSLNPSSKLSFLPLCFQFQRPSQ